jgi:PhzF family phenazine biosynthesis protein
MMMRFEFQQVDVFSAKPLHGNALAVVVGADALSTAQMAAFARWTNLAETTFLLQPTDPRADYRVRIFTPETELPFAGHPTLGSCHVWLGSGGVSKGADIIQQCGVGLVTLRRDGGQLAFIAPPLRRSGPVEPEIMAQIMRGLAITPDDIVRAAWVDNGPGWVAVQLKSRTALMALTPDYAALIGINLGAVALIDSVKAGDPAIEVRAFVPGSSVPEDPVTGSLNASVAQWLIGAGVLSAPYVAAQGAALGRDGRVYIRQDGADIWVGGETVTCITGTVTI